MPVKVVVTVGDRQVGRAADKVAGKERQERKGSAGTDGKQGAGEIEQESGSQERKPPGSDEETGGLEAVGCHGWVLMCIFCRVIKVAVDIRRVFPCSWSCSNPCLILQGKPGVHGQSTVIRMPGISLQSGQFSAHPASLTTLHPRHPVHHSPYLQPPAVAVPLSRSTDQPVSAPFFRLERGRNHPLPKGSYAFIRYSQVR